MEALSAMDRVKQVEAIHGYNSMKANLMEHLKKFAENKKVVSKEDIQEFFQQLQANKRPRSEMPFYFKWFIWQSLKETKYPTPKSTTTL